MLLVVGFGKSSQLASAYGISVTGDMLVTTMLLFVVMRVALEMADSRSLRR